MQRLALGAATLIALAALGAWWFGIPARTAAEATELSAPPAGRVVELDPDKQKFIWDLEHVTFLTEKYVGKPLVTALAARDRDRVLAFFNDDFKGRVAASHQGTERRVGILSDRRVETASVGARDVDAGGFVDELLRSWSNIRTFEHGKLRVLQIDGAEGRFSTRLTLVGTGRDAQGNPIQVESEHDAIIAFDDEERLKQDGKALSGATIDFEIVRRSRAPLMEEATERMGLAELGLLDNWKVDLEQTRFRRYQPAVEDFDRDGYLDIALGAPNGQPRLLRYADGRFVDVAAELGLKPGRNEPMLTAINATVAWIDYDNDGYPDLLMGHSLYHNEGGKEFRDVTAGTGLKFDRVPLGVSVADYDVDGRLDLYFSYQKGFRERGPGKKPWVDDSEAGTDNHLWRNVGGGRFENVTDQTNASGGKHQTFATSVFFYDDDRFPDLYLANDFGRNVLLRNRGDGSFEDVTATSRSGDFATSMGVSTGDLDNDGTPEIYVANMFSKMGRRIIAHVDEQDYPPGIHDQIVGSCAGNRLYRRDPGQPTYDEISEAAGVNQVGWAYAPAMVDLNGDGLLDLYATTGYMSFDRNKPDG